MAIDKSRTKPIVKIGIVLVAAVLVLGIGGASLVPLLQVFTAPATNTTTTGSANSTDTVGAIALKYSPRTQTNEEALKADQKNYDLLVAQANAYHDWAAEVAQATATSPTGADRPMWLAAAGYYKRALEVKPGDPNVTTDYSIALFYSGDTATAIATAEGVAKADPKFAPVRFNLGVFYAQTNDAARSIAAFEAYLAIEPKGELADEAKSRIQEIKTASQGTTVTP